MKIAILGGSFNPIHKGHIKNAEEVLKYAKVDRVLLMPCYKHAFGKKILPFEQRMEMTKLAVEENGNPRLIASDYEKQIKSTYSVEMARAFAKDYGPEFLGLIVGTDVLLTFYKWRYVNELMKIMRLVIVPRPGYPLSYLPKDAIYLEHARSLPIASSELREMLVARDNIAKHFIPKSVFAHIKKNNLYSENAENKIKMVSEVRI